VFADCIELFNSSHRYSEVYYFNHAVVKALAGVIGSILPAVGGGLPLPTDNLP